MIFIHIRRLLPGHNTTYLGLLLKKIPSFLQPVKDDLELKVSESVEHAL
jgi:hypothetical protein